MVSYYNFPGMITDFNFLIGTGSYTENLDFIQNIFIKS
jgi:hypothetical protein